MAQKLPFAFYRGDFPPFLGGNRVEVREYPRLRCKGLIPEGTFVRFDYPDEGDTPDEGTIIGRTIVLTSWSNTEIKGLRVSKDDGGKYCAREWRSYLLEEIEAHGGFRALHLEP